MQYLATLLAIIVAYLLGSLSSAIIVCKLMGLPDPRTEGSKNPGATNVLRIGGKKAAIITLLGDMLKGLLPVLGAKYLGFSGLSLGLVAFATFIGHLYPIFFNFIGGKGVATLLGCLLALSWPVGGTWLLIWIAVAFIFHYSSLAALIASLLAPIYTWYFTHDENYVVIVGLMALFLFYRHRKNIANLLSGKESKIGKK